jgi:hypothetical protein
MDAVGGRREALCTHRPTGPELDTRRVLVIEHKAYDAVRDIRARCRRRFSTGIEQLPETARKLHVGRFSVGSEQLPETARKLRVGRFSEGSEQLPSTARRLGVGRFSEGVEQTRRKLRRGSFADGFHCSQPERSSRT